MTAQERNEIERLTLAIEDQSEKLDGIRTDMLSLREEVHVHVATTAKTFEKVRELCDERHGLHPGRFSRLEEVAREATAERRANTYTLKTMFLVAGLSATVLSIIVGIVLHFA